MGEKKRIAIVGGGISGVACTWALRKSRHEVHLFEADSELGGHANAFEVTQDGNTHLMDVGFIAFNKETYPNFSAFLHHLGVSALKTDMSFSVTTDNGSFEWAGHSIRGFLAQIGNLFNLKFWRLILEILHFTLFAPGIIHKGNGCSRCGSRQSSTALDSSYTGLEDDCESIGDYLKRNNYSRLFQYGYLIPMASAPWCIDPDEFASSFPARKLIEFMWNHKILNSLFRPLDWNVIKHSSRSYIDAFNRSKPSRHIVHLETQVKSLRRGIQGSTALELQDGTTEYYDHVVLAVHASQALRILGDDVLEDEERPLSACKTVLNHGVLHFDEAYMPRRRAAQASWNYLATPSHQLSKAVRSGWKHSQEPSCEKSSGRICVTFDLNRLHRIPTSKSKHETSRYLLTLNPPHRPQRSVAEFYYSHPSFSCSSFEAQKHLSEVNGRNGISFAGAWMGYGFHEDGFVAGLQAANHVLIDDPVPIQHFEANNSTDIVTSLILFLARFVVFGVWRVVEFLETFQRPLRLV